MAQTHGLIMQRSLPLPSSCTTVSTHPHIIHTESYDESLDDQPLTSQVAWCTSVRALPRLLEGFTVTTAVLESEKDKHRSGDPSGKSVTENVQLAAQRETASLTFPSTQRLRRWPSIRPAVAHFSLRESVFVVGNTCIPGSQGRVFMSPRPCVRSP